MKHKYLDKIITENNLIVSLCYDSKTLKIHDISGDLLLKKEKSNYRKRLPRKHSIYARLYRPRTRLVRRL